ncbi:MAG TPA: AAA family ATPase [Bryobacteraceae bacterium]|nr:AAA family ATPase [Bryobacteraceae bacterium]
MPASTDTSALILLLQENSADGEYIREALADSGGGFRVQSLERVGTALARIAGGGVDLVILDLSRSKKPETEACEDFLKLRTNAPQMPIVVVVESDADSLIVRTVKSGAALCLTRARCKTDLNSMVRNVIDRRVAPPVAIPELHKGGIVITVLGAKGGVGTTTVALNVASGLTESRRVILAELRPTYGTLTPYFRPPRLAGNLAYLLRPDAATISVAEVEARVWPSKDVPGLNILFGPQILEECREAPAHSVKTVLKALSAAADYVVVDLPSGLSEANRAAIQESDCLLLVVEPDPLCVETGAQILKTIRIWNDLPKLTRSVIVNRAPRAFSMNESDIGKKLAIPTLGVIPLATDLCIAAEEAGMPLALVAPGSGAAKSLASLALTVAQESRMSVAPLPAIQPESQPA